MKRALFSVFRLFMFVGLLILFHSRGSQAQVGIDAAGCFTGQNSDDDCSNIPGAGCTNSNPPFWPYYDGNETSSTGVMSVSLLSWSCGTAVTPPKGSGIAKSVCSGTSYQVQSNSNCCVPSGYKSSNGQTNCCAPAILLSTGYCGSCSGQDGTCGNDGDCCSGFSCTNGYCDEPTCGDAGAGCGSERLCMRCTPGLRSRHDLHISRYLSAGHSPPGR